MAPNLKVIFLCSLFPIVLDDSNVTHCLPLGVLVLVANGDILFWMFSWKMLWLEGAVVISLLFDQICAATVSDKLCSCVASQVWGLVALHLNILGSYIIGRSSLCAF